jgi:DNA-binding transcriptional LysR family regulator
MLCEASLHNVAMFAHVSAGPLLALSPDRFGAVFAFARVAHHSSFTRAAAELGVSTSALSQSIRSLEACVNMRLLHRSTRKVGVTEAGQQFLVDMEPAIAAWSTALDSVAESRERPAGVLRLNLSKAAADVLVMPHLVDFIDAYPDVTLEMHCDNALVDLVAGGFDAGIRLGEKLAQDMVALPLGRHQRLAVVAAPRYLHGRTVPRTPADLAGHRCLNGRLGGGIYRWEFAQKDRIFEMEVAGPMLTNDGDLLLDAARAGAGIATGFEALVREDIKAGRLQPLLEEWWPDFGGFFLYYSSRKMVPRKLRAFIDFMQSRWPTTG